MNLETEQKMSEIVRRHVERNVATLDYHCGREFYVAPDVFSPFVGPSGVLGLTFSCLPLIRGQRILDVGCGSGVIATSMALNGAKQVVGTDINPSAIINAGDNARSHNVKDRTSFRLGNLIDPINSDERFDLVFADLPFTQGDPKTMLERAFFEKELRSIRGLLDAISTSPTLSDARGFICLCNADGLDLKEYATSLRLSWKPFLSYSLDWLRLDIIEVTRGK